MEPIWKKFSIKQVFVTTIFLVVILTGIGLVAQPYISTLLFIVLTLIWLLLVWNETKKVRQVTGWRIAGEIIALILFLAGLYWITNRRMISGSLLWGATICLSPAMNEFMARNSIAPQRYTRGARILIALLLILLSGAITL